MTEQNDNQIIRKVIAGDVNSYSMVINRYKRQGFNLAFRICHNRENAEEILQNVFINIYQNLSNFKFECKFSTWFYRIVYNQSISYIRKLNKTELSVNDLDVNLEPTDESKTMIELLSDSDTVHYLEQALGELMPDESALLHLYYFEEKKIFEICEITGLSVSNIKIKLYRTRKKLYSILKRLLQKEFVDFYG